MFDGFLLFFSFYICVNGLPGNHNDSKVGQAHQVTYLSWNTVSDLQRVNMVIQIGIKIWKNKEFKLENKISSTS